MTTLVPKSMDRITNRLQTQLIICLRQTIRFAASQTRYTLASTDSPLPPPTPRTHHFHSQFYYSVQCTPFDRRNVCRTIKLTQLSITWRMLQIRHVLRTQSNGAMLFAAYMLCASHGNSISLSKKGDRSSVSRPATVHQNIPQENLH